jgi:exodeoxyribonuclease V alpha subunit
MKLDSSQLAAVEAATTSRFSIINGGAGCGKTTIIRQVKDEVKARGEPVLLCAFAGKAAARLKEATGEGAATIHRMLNYQGDLGFTRPTLKGYTVILDEASMVSSDLMAEIVKREPKRLILVGDEAQLAPVGSGQPFHDLIRLRPDRVQTLTTCYRNAEAIFRAAAAIRVGNMPAVQEQTAEELWRVCATGGADETHAAILKAVRDGYIDFKQDVILCCRNGESADQKCAVDGLNRDLKDIVNPAQGDEKINVGDRIINTKNNADLDIWNGTTGTVKAIDHGGAVWLTLDYPILDYVRSKPDAPVYISDVLVTKDKVRYLSLAYALTTHKAQGSQYRRVVFVCLCRDQMTLLDRSMIYTAVTRARCECSVVGEYRALADGINTVRSKNTVLQELAKAGGLTA